MVEIKDIANVATEVAWEVSTAETPENIAVTDAPEWDINMTMPSDATDNTENTEDTEKEKKEDKKENKKDKKDKEKKEEKAQVVPSKKEICEFYGIRDEEILDENSNLSKYDMPKWYEEALREWAKNQVKENLKEVKFDLYEKNEDVRKILEKYWVLPHHVAEGKLDDLWLDKNEKKIIENYYNEKAKNI